MNSNSVLIRGISSRQRCISCVTSSMRFAISLRSDISPTCSISLESCWSLVAHRILVAPLRECAASETPLTSDCSADLRICVTRASPDNSSSSSRELINSRFPLQNLVNASPLLEDGLLNVVSSLLLDSAAETVPSPC